MAAADSLPVAQRQEQRPLSAWKESPGAGGPDDSLTNLQWLQEFSFLPAPAPEAPSASGQLGPSRVPQGSSGPASPPAGDTAAEGMPLSMGKPTSSGTGLLRPPALAPEAADYKTDARVKPPYSYATLICMAMRASQQAKLTLSAIYTWIMENFSYYRHAEPSWQVRAAPPLGGKGPGQRRPASWGFGVLVAFMRVGRGEGSLGEPLGTSARARPPSPSTAPLSCPHVRLCILAELHPTQPVPEQVFPEGAAWKG